MRATVFANAALLDNAEGELDSNLKQHARDGDARSMLPMRTTVVTAVETHYYWPDLVANMREVLRVLKPSGKFVIIAEAYKLNKRGNVSEMSMKLIRATYLSATEHREIFSQAGYSEVKVFEDAKKGWICGTAIRPF
jgi:SAM-dependent methyltransferase